MSILNSGRRLPIVDARVITRLRTQFAMFTKYESLRLFLHAMPSARLTVELPLAKVERILGTELPPSAYRHPTWWANQATAHSRPQARAWLAAGFEVDLVDQSPAQAWVRFRRIQPCQN